MVLLRRLLGDVLRRHRIRQSRTLRDVSSAAGVSLGYLSEVERGRKEASSELLAAICGALEVSMSEVLHEVGDDLAREERRVRLAPVGFATASSSRVPMPTMPVRPVAGIPPHHPARPLPKPEPVTPVASVSTAAPFGAIVAA
ncbi:MAG TPA: helix-turn-helix transcriptional regulator [Mycobacteriales bacterium]|jgi:transcriptional regulator with XRE-family HTH domain|nr:helix-turn-helix transcriptional regulator [Mycobacteriales bacterium]